ncbi:MAG: hypothetical protein ABI907_08385 [Ramlibacter sp.]
MRRKLALHQEFTMSAALNDLENFVDLFAELRDAEADDVEARQEALYRGLVATQPLTAVRLQELCALGEKMLHTGLRKTAALARIRQAVS